MTNQPSAHPEDRLARLLAATEHDAVPVDRAALAAIRERSLAEFIAAGAEPVLSHAQRTNMFFARAAIALVTAAAAVGGVIFLRDRPAPVANVTLGSVVKNFTLYQDLHGTLTADGVTRQVFRGDEDELRIETAPGQYEISRGAQSWTVDEADNRAVPSASPYYSPQLAAIDPLRLLDFDTDDFRDLKPVEKRRVNGRDQFVFYCARPVEGGTRELAVVADATPYHQLVSIESRQVIAGKATPLAEFKPFAVPNRQPLPVALFQVPATLTEDGRIGKVTDHQGLVSLRPLASTRWTPICSETILRPGDWLRTDFQGANAATVQLAPQTKLILGPGSLVELSKPDQIRLFSGIAELTPSPKVDNFSGIIKLTGPGGETLDAGGLVLVRADEKGLTKLAKDPPWLAGYKGTAAKESLGSLITTIDGREVPLTVGYHKVNVEIRDQVARTTIEESFVNHTNTRLEGQFHFPLPADASISGFGMWIGNKLVEADIVEKQRAREIYETILREKRDPGLLEWTGGNIFKARVFPIEPQSEKRIKIVYTQVLPRKGDRYRYNYALQSELLRQNPLRQLDLEVTISSTQPLASIQSPTHPTRGQATGHSARLEFSAQQYTPTRDFEAVVTLAGQSQDVTFIPHQRGEDGYFLLLLQPPTEGGAWQRDVVPDSAPLNLIVLADTSASMDRASRRNQAEVLAALLGSLSPKDRFQLAACDVNCVWAGPQPQAADEKNVTAARDFLTKRRSLGWTDLGRAFDEALQRAAPGTQIVYVGDGVVTNVGASGLAFTQRAAASAVGKGLTCHAIAVSSSYDQAVLRGLAAIGGGSVRAISGENGPQPTARDLLAEITRPALRNIQLEFKGLKTARVYPRTLPNIPAGTQQIVLGRFLPPAKAGAEVIVTGTLNGKPVTYRTAISSPTLRGGASRDGVAGYKVASYSDDDSFIPRLWARLHLDELLAQGGSQQMQDEIIALSEEFHIITPYTSLLVLESDADRERFKVKKRMLMRDGERFFAEGRDNAQYELVQQQMRAAGLWRVALRQRVLAQLARLGRDAGSLPVPRPQAAADFNGLIDLISQTTTPQSWYGVDGSDSISALGGNLSLVVGQAQEIDEKKQLGDYRGEEFESFGRTSRDRLVRLGDREELLDVMRRTDLALAAGLPVNSPAPLPTLDPAAPAEPAFATDGTRLFAGEELSKELQSLAGDEYGTNMFFGLSKARLDPFSTYDDGRRRSALLSDSSPWPRGLTPYRSAPSFLPISLAPAPATAAGPAKPRKSNWPAEAQEISRSLQTSIDLAALAGGLRVEESEDHYDAPRGRLRYQSQSLGLHSVKSWLTRSEGDENDTLLDWASATERGLASLAYEVALVRTSAPTDLPKSWQPRDWWLHSPEWSYQSHTVEIQRPAEGPVVLVLKHILRPHEEVRLRIDTAKKVVLAFETYQFGAITGKIEAQEHVQIAGIWLPQKIVQTGEAGRQLRNSSRKYTLLPADQFTAGFDEQLKEQASALRIRMPAPALDKAQAAAAAGRAALEDRLVILQDLANRQLWPAALNELEAIEKLIAGKVFAPWLRLWLLEQSRRHEDLRQLALSLAPQLAQQQRPGDYVLAQRLFGYAGNNLQAGEVLAIVDLLRPVFARQPERTRALAKWNAWRAPRLLEAGKLDEELALWRQLATDYPDERDYQAHYARTFREGGDYDAAYAWLKAALAHPAAKWSASDRDYLYNVWAEMLRDQGRWADIAALSAEWIKQLPETADAYELHYAALYYTNRYDEADRVLAEWFAAGIAAPSLTETTEPPLYAAIETVQGENSYIRGDDDPSWYGKLAEVLRTYVDRPDQRSIVSNISGQWRFRNSDQFRTAGRQITDRLKAQAGALPLGRLVQLADWVASYASDVTEDDLRAIAAAVRPRWEAATHPAAEEALAGLLTTTYGRIGQSERLAFLRLRLEKADDDNRAGRAQQLFEALLEQAWTAEYEAEAFALLDKLAGGADAALKLRQQIYYLHRWVDRMLQARNERYEQDIKEPEKLKRTELADKRKENQQRARTDLADKLAAAAAAREGGLKDWLLIERLHLEIKAEREPAKVAEACFELLGPQPPAAKAADSELTLAELLDLQFRARLLTMLTYLAAQRETQAAVTPRLEKYLDALIAQDPDSTRLALDGRRAKFALLVAQDRPQELLTALSQWARQVRYPQAWQRDLAYLHAELGQLVEAVNLAEALIKDDAWRGGDYRQLAQWQQALGQKAKYEAALVAAYQQYEEYQLQQMLSQAQQPWSRLDAATPTAIDPQVLLIQKALYQKASRPQQYVYLSRSFYEASRDFRLLAGLAEAVIGQSALNVYPFLGEMKSTLDEIDREAAADEMLRHIGTLRGQAKSPTDQRALDLLEMLAERRAAEVQNQPGPHVEQAIAALQRAERREWSPGEPRLAAEMLGHLGRISQKPLADDVLRVMTALHAAEKEGTYDRLRVARWLAEALNDHGRRELAIAVLEAAIPDYRRTKQGRATSELVEPIALLSDLYSSAEQFVRAEAVLRAEVPRAINRNVADDLTWRIYGVHNRALARRGTTSLGSGETLYQNLQAELQEAATATPDQRQRRRLINELTQFYRQAHDLKFAAAAADTRRFATDVFPALLARQVNDYQDLVASVHGCVRHVLGPRESLAFLIARIEAEPRWQSRQGDSGWRRLGYTLGSLKEELPARGEGSLGNLEPRLLAIVLKELRRDLETQQSHNRVLYASGYQYYWKEKRDDFARVAEEVLATRRESESSLLYIADYLFKGLELQDRAIALLLDAHRQKRLSDNGQWELAHYLHARGRYGESVPILEGLVERHRTSLGYHTLLMYAYFQTKRQDALLALLATADKVAHEDDRWNEHVAVQLAQACLDCELYEQTVTYYEEAIARRKEARGNRTAGDQQLAQYYAELALAWAGLKNTEKAVEAAGGAIVGWGAAGDVSLRKRGTLKPLDVLREVLKAAPNLDAYVASVDKEAVGKQEDSAIIRKALGEVYFERREFGKAAAQLKIAAELAPNDAAVHEKLVACYDALQDGPAAAEQLLASVELKRRDVGLWASLAQRLQALGQADEAERARTSLVEMLPGETEGHTKLAELRQEAGRWDDAILHWREVATLRKLEPAGLLSLAAAELHEKQKAAADATLKQLETTDWPARFHDELRQKLPQLRDAWRKL